MEKKIFLYSNGRRASIECEDMFRRKIPDIGLSIIDEYSPDADLLICIGGDGTFLEALHKFKFPQMPIIGINTGHLGFFQELMPDQLDYLLSEFKAEHYKLQPMSTAEIEIQTSVGKYRHMGLNEVVIRSPNNHTIHLDISIDGVFMQRFSGDGVVVSTPAGSTAYNYSLGGSIVDPRLMLLQLTPIAPMNTTAYRSFTSSILIPSDLKFGLVPEVDSASAITVVYDGYSANYTDVREMNVTYSPVKVHLVRFDRYDFWTKVKSKFL